MLTGSRFAGPRFAGPRFALVQTYRLATDPYRYYPAMRARYGPEFVVPALNGPVLVVTTPDGVKDVFTAPPETFLPFGTEAVGPVLGAFSVLSLAGEPHKKGRKLLAPPFHGARMRAYGHAMREVAQSEVARLGLHEPTTAHELTRQISMGVILRTVFGAEGETTAHVRTQLEAILGGFSPAYLFTKALQRRLFPAWRRFLDAREALADYVRRGAAERRAEGARDREDILTMLALAEHDDGTLLSDAELTDHLLTLLVAGHETTAIALAWSLYWLARTPDALTTLRAELAEHAAAEPEAIARLPFLSAVCDESLRLNTIVPDPVRLLAQPLTVRGHVVPAGMGVCIASDVIHQDAAIYPEPERFRPERFLETKPSPFSFLPFGGGHRRCIGAAFSDFEARIALAEIVRTRDFHLVHSDPEPAVRRNVTMGPARGVPIVFTPRAL
ncbi:MAG: cytochrome P450 [Deltaproteobacteria bacterium]|jgi:cytochrome P450